MDDYTRRYCGQPSPCKYENIYFYDAVTASACFKCLRDVWWVSNSRFVLTYTPHKNEFEICLGIRSSSGANSTSTVWWGPQDRRASRGMVRIRISFRWTDIGPMTRDRIWHQTLTHIPALEIVHRGLECARHTNGDQNLIYILIEQQKSLYLKPIVIFW